MSLHKLKNPYHETGLNRHLLTKRDTADHSSMRQPTSFPSSVPSPSPNCPQKPPTGSCLWTSQLLPSGWFPRCTSSPSIKLCLLNFISGTVLVSMTVKPQHLALIDQLQQHYHFIWEWGIKVASKSFSKYTYTHPYN